MKVLMILDDTFKPDLRVMKEARTLIKKGFDVNLLCWDRHSNLPEESKEEGIDVKRFKIRSGHQLGIFQIRYLLKFYILVISYIWKRRNEYDLLWVHDYPDLFLGIILKFFLRRPLIYDAHEIYYLMEYEKYSPFIRNILKYSEILFIQFVDGLIMVSDTRLCCYQKYYRRKKIYIIGNWYAPIDIDSRDFHKYREQSNEQFTIGYFGTLAKQRKLDLLFELAQKRKTLTILIGGSGAEEEHIREMSSNFDNVKFYGWIKDITSILSRVDALYYVLDENRAYSKFNSPNTLYLAVAANIPLITNYLGEVGKVMESINKNITLKRNSLEELLRVVSLLQDKKFYNFVKKEMLPLQKRYNLEKFETVISLILRYVIN